MSLTPNYSFIIPTGTDAVNLLTQCYPNFTSLDTILVPIEENGVTPSTHTKVGTVHQIVRTKSMCNMFRFVATANYASGDTFTIDGASVTTTAVDGTALPAGAFVINQSVVGIVNGTVLTILVPGTITLPTINASSVVYDNSVSGLTATDVQNAIDELQNEISSLPSNEHGLYEKWANPNPTSAYVPSTPVVLTDIDTTKVDALEIEWAIDRTETSGIVTKRYELSAFLNNTLSVSENEVTIASASHIILEKQRSVSITHSSTTITLTFGSGYNLAYPTYGGAPIQTENNDVLVPVRILTLMHNS